MARGSIIISMTMAMHSPLEQFEVIALFPSILPRTFVDLSITNSVLLAVLAAVTFVVLSDISTTPRVGVDGSVQGNGTLAPSRFQTIMESLYEMVLGMILTTVGPVGIKYVPFVFALFTFRLSCNRLGMVPYSFTVTSHLIVTLTLAMTVWVGKLYIGVNKHGIKLLGLLLPGGTPMAIVPFLVAIELMGFVITIISLSVRIFANMMAGHILLKVMAGFAWTMMFAGGLVYLGHFLPLIVLFALLGLETVVALVQAYVFTLLTCIYLADAISGGH